MLLEPWSLIAFRPHGPIFELRIVMFCEFLIVIHSPVVELIRTFSITVPLFPSITRGPDGASELADPDGVGVGDFVLVAVDVGDGEGFAALAVAVGLSVALGELLLAGIVVVLVDGPVTGCDVGFCVVGAALACGVAVAFGVASGVAGADVVGVAVGGADGPWLATVKCPRRLEVWPKDHFSSTRIVCDPSASAVVSYGIAVPSLAVPA